MNAVTTRDKSDTGKINKNETPPPVESSTDVSATTNVDDLEEVVFVVQKDGTVKKVRVRTDIQDINYIEVLSGLAEGDEVVTNPFNVVSKTLKDGMKVKVVPKNQNVAAENCTENNGTFCKNKY